MGFFLQQVPEYRVVVVVVVVVGVAADEERVGEGAETRYLLIIMQIDYGE